MKRNLIKVIVSTLLTCIVAIPTIMPSAEGISETQEIESENTITETDKGISEVEIITTEESAEAESGSRAIAENEESVEVTSRSSSISQNIIVNRIYGDTRYSTSQEISFGTDATTMIIVNGTDFADALSASALAEKENGAIFLVDGKKLDQGIKDYFDIYINEYDKVIIVGGTGAVSTEIENDLKKEISNVIRIGGKDRYETSLKVAQHIGSFEKAFIAVGNNFADALSVGSIAGKNSYPIILTNGNELSKEAISLLNSNNVNNTYIVGGSGVISDNILNSVPNGKRLGGRTRYDTNYEVIKEFASELNGEKAYVAIGNNFPDALAASTRAARENAAIILTTNNPDDTMKNMVNTSGANEIVALGGPAVISMEAMETLAGRAILNNSNGAKSVAEIRSYMESKGLTLDRDAVSHFLYMINPETGNYESVIYAQALSDRNSLLYSTNFIDETKEITLGVLKMALPNSYNEFYNLLLSNPPSQELLIDGKYVSIDNLYRQGTPTFYIKY